MRHDLYFSIELFRAVQSYSKLKEVTNIGSAINEKKRTIKGNDEPKSEELKIFKLL